MSGFHDRSMRTVLTERWCYFRWAWMLRSASSLLNLKWGTESPVLISLLRDWEWELLRFLCGWRSVMHASELKRGYVSSLIITSLQIVLCWRTMVYIRHRKRVYVLKLRPAWRIHALVHVFMNLVDCNAKNIHQLRDITEERNLISDQWYRIRMMHCDETSYLK